MKSIKFVISSFLSLTLIAVSCSNGDKSAAGFNPKDRTTVEMSAQERELALRALKENMNGNVDSLLKTGRVRLSVLPPAAEFLSESQTEEVALRMLQMLSANGIGGINNSPGFALTAAVASGTEKVTDTAPQKYLKEFKITYTVLNTVTGDVYGTYAQTVTGAGSTPEEAMDNALAQIGSNSDMQSMLSVASTRIVDWYDSNLSEFKSQVGSAEARGDYALASALIESVPSQASEAYKYAESRRRDIEGKLMRQIAGQELSQMKEAILASEDAYDARVYAHYNMIDPSSAAYKEAGALLQKYEADVKTKRQVNDERERADLEAERTAQMELAKMENSRIKAKYEAQATEQAIRLHLSQNASRGFWSNLGARLLSLIDGTSWQYRVKEKPYTED